MPTGGTHPLESFAIVVERLATRFETKILDDFSRELRRAFAGNMEALDRLNNYRPDNPAALTPNLAPWLDDTIKVDAEIIDDLANRSVRDIVDRQHAINRSR